MPNQETDPVQVLLVEDDPGDAGLIRHALEDDRFRQYETTWVTTLGEARKRLNTRDFDVILLDLSLPDTQGLETVHGGLEAARGIPVVILTGRDDDDLALRILDLGAQDYLVKGRHDTDALLRALRHAQARAGTERALRRSEALLSGILDNTLDAVWSATWPDFQVLFVSPSIERIFGRSRDEFQTDPRLLFEAIVLEDRSIAEAGHKELLRHGFSDVEYRICRPDGEIAWVRDRSKVIRRPDGGPERVDGVLSDISQRREAEQRLHDYTVRLEHANRELDAALVRADAGNLARAVVEDQTELVCRFSTQGALTFVNHAFCRCHGRAEADLLGRPFTTALHAEDVQRARDTVYGLTALEPLAGCELRVVLPDGRVCWQEWNYRAVSGEQGVVLDYQGVGRDVTRRKELEQRLLHAREQVRRRLGRELHDGLCQELKALEMEAALLEDTCREGGSLAADRAAVIGDRLNKAVRSAHGIARGLLPVGMDARGFAPALGELVSELRRNHRVLIRADIQENVSPGNEEQALHLFRIAQEALGNALRHAQAVEIRLFWGLVDGQAVLKIQDDGVGMDVGAATCDPQGLGLNVMRSRAQALGGQLEVSSPSGEGVRVEVRIPKGVRAEG